MTARRVVGRKGRNSVVKNGSDESWVVELVKAGCKKVCLAVTVATTGDVLVAQKAENGKQPVEADAEEDEHKTPAKHDAPVGGYDTYPAGVVCRAKS